MLIVVFGATGKVGRLVIGEALSRGHEVVGFTHSAELPEQAGLTIKQGDIHDAVAVTKAIGGADAVISALGSWGTSGKDILSAAMDNVIPTMRSYKINRIVSLTGLDAEAEGDSFSIAHYFSRIILKIVGNKVLQDSEKHIKMLEMSQLNWTVVRSPRMNNGSKNYVLSQKRIKPWSVASREAVAMSLVDLAEGRNYSKQAPYIKNA